MAAGNDVRVYIDGEQYTVSGDQDEEYIRRIAGYIDGKIREVSRQKSYGRLDQKTRSILLDINIADDYFSQRKKAEDAEKSRKSLQNDFFDLKSSYDKLSRDTEKLKKEFSKQEEVLKKEAAYAEEKAKEAERKAASDKKEEIAGQVEKIKKSYQEQLNKIIASRQQELNKYKAQCEQQLKRQKAAAEEQIKKSREEQQKKASEDAKAARQAADEVHDAETEKLRKDIEKLRQEIDELKEENHEFEIENVKLTERLKNTSGDAVPVREDKAADDKGNAAANVSNVKSSTKDTAVNVKDRQHNGSAHGKSGTGRK